MRGRGLLLSICALTMVGAVAFVFLRELPSEAVGAKGALGELRVPNPVFDVEAIAKDVSRDSAVIADTPRSPEDGNEFSDLLARLLADRAIVGVVRAPDGTPIEGALVWLLHPTDDDPLDSRITDPRGRFALPIRGAIDTLPASFRVVAHAARYGISEPVVVPRPEAGRPINVELAAMRERGVARGRVVGPSGQGVPGHAVLLVRVDQDLHSTSEWQAGRDDVELHTDSNGEFLARGLRPGTFEVDATPSDPTAGFLPTGTEQLPVVSTGAPPIVVRLRHVRVDVCSYDDDGTELAGDRFELHVYAEINAMLAASQFAASGVIESRGVAATAHLEHKKRGKRASFWVAPGCFVVAEVEDGPRRDVLAGWVPRDVSVFVLAVEHRAVAPGVLVLRVRAEDGANLQHVVCRIGANQSAPYVPEGATALVGGYFELPRDGRLELPPSNHHVTVLGEPRSTSTRMWPGQYLPAEFDIAISRASTDTRELALARGAMVEFALDCEASTHRETESRFFAGRVGELGVLRARAESARSGSESEPLLLGATTDDGGYAELGGLPWRSAAQTTAVVLRTFVPGIVELSIVSWRGTQIGGGDDRLTIDLVPGINRIRLRVDPELLVHVIGR